MSEEYDEEPWRLTVAHLEGLRLMRPEKAWRPIVTLEVDKHHAHETVLGVDGQSINQKQSFHFHGSSSSNVEVKVWYRSQSKKKKGKVLVASASHKLVELWKKQDHDSTTSYYQEVEIKLQCRSPDGRKSLSTCSRGRQQKGACLRVKIHPPTPSPFSRQSSQLESEQDEPNLSADEGSCSSSSSDSISTISIQSASRSPSPSPETEPLIQPAQGLRRRRKPRGYIINTDDEICSTDAEHSPQKPCFEDNSTCVDDDEPEEELSIEGGLIIKRGDVISWKQGEDGQLIAVSSEILPMYTERLTVTPEMSRIELALAAFTMYRELRMAVMDSQFEKVFGRLQMEWTYIGGLLVALAAVDTAVFSISSDSTFEVDNYARSAIAASSVASGLGIACDAWFLLRYNWIDLQTFKERAKDVFGSYFFFSLSARTPALCMFISAVSLMGFLGIVSFRAWPQGVTVVFFVVGIIMSLQFFAYGAHWAASTMAHGGRAVVRRMTMGSVSQTKV
ncbi:hypothetical protein CVT24_004214 [Panaeolus cyanescens]|uniref:Uncharacterized protein n=1 Tax=Panaeolus cyanescens TaxID=181874 RepID=A0A409YSY2_9AGAR|nr:hypothetical protein CVT24_004214 [Panaeolus cyanescens]